MSQRSLLRSLRTLIHKLTAPESTALVAAPAPHGTWKQVKVPGTDIVRSYIFSCRGHQQELTLSEAKENKIRKCGCGLSFNLRRDLALAPDSTISDYEYALASLPVHALAVRAPQQPYKVVQVGDEPFHVEWSGKQNRARDAAFDAGDPGYTGMF
jgi:hypothetical protein